MWFITKHPIDPATPPDKFYVRPFMVGRTCEALIAYIETFGDHGNTLTPLIKLAADEMWKTLWNPQTLTFAYTDRVVSSGDMTYQSHDINGLIAFMYGWLAKVTGNQVYRERGDQIFAGANDAPGWPYTKQFNQLQNETYKYLLIRK
jgi:hypothetical protein